MAIEIISNEVIPFVLGGTFDLMWALTVLLSLGISSIVGLLLLKMMEIYKFKDFLVVKLGSNGAFGRGGKRPLAASKPQASVAENIMKMNSGSTQSLVMTDNTSLEFDYDSSPITFRGSQALADKSEFEVLPTYVSRFDQLIDDRGIERGSTLLVSGGAGTGKTTFSLQSLYYGALKGEKGIYLSFEEQPSKIKAHMKKNFGWDLDELEEKGLVAVLRIDPAKIAKSIEQSMLEKEGGLKIALKRIELPFIPDRVVVDSLSALSIAFEKEEIYRRYLRELFEALEASKAVSFVLSETEQNPKVYSRTGVEEFLADGVIVLYNMKKDGKRENALEILKLRSSRHRKGLIPYTFSKTGIDIMPKTL